MIQAAAVERATQRIGRELLARIEAARPADYAARAAADPLACWSARGPKALAEVFRFIDVIPALARDEDLLEHLRSYLSDPAELCLGPAPTPAAVRAVVRALQDRFIAGETADEALRRCRELCDSGAAFTLDILGEAVVSEAEAERYFHAYLDLLRRADEAARGWPAADRTGDYSFGRVARVNVSLKLSSLYHRFDPMDPRGAFEGAAPRLRAILRLARERGATVNVDMEQYALKDLTLDLFKAVLMEPDFRDWDGASITLQTYLCDPQPDLAGMADWAGGRGAPIHARLVKGAYWDHEVQNAAYQNWPWPVHVVKAHTDAEFEAATRFLLERRDRFRLAVAGHNVRSVAHAMAVAEALELPGEFVEYQMLCGLGEELRRAVTAAGGRARVYMPFGRLVPGMAYLARRLLEATSRSSFLRQMRASPLPAEELLAAPANESSCHVHRPQPAFQNEPLSDFSQAQPRREMAEALERVRAQFGASYPLWIDGAPAGARGETEQRNPSRAAEVVGRVARASRREARRAVAAAQRAFPDWARRPASERAGLLRRAAAIVRKRRYDLAAWEVFETAKPWREADADVAEATDYLEFYANEAERLAEPRRRDAAGEDNLHFHEPRGVAAAITPWNFPLAILAGVTSAAAVVGNTVIMKPAEQSSIVAAKFMEIWTEAGAPAGVIQFLPGIGEEAGDLLARHPDVRVIAFTGSLEVGLRIRRLAAGRARTRAPLKQVIAEMGGKNAVLVDRDADLDQAVPGVMASAFGYAGQKCSACSRVIVHRDVCAAFLDRLVEAARSLPVGPADDPQFPMGPLIDEAALRRVNGFIERGKASAKVALEVTLPGLAGQGWYAGPAIFSDVDPNAEIAQEEIFGPVLCVIPAASFDEAVQIANGVKYGLTAGLYSRDPRHIARAGELQAGNIYVNRAITGARVDRQPFGGLKLSGVGAKAGGPDYLLQFLQPKSLTEWTVRRGFTPPEKT